DEERRNLNHSPREQHDGAATVFAPPKPAAPTWRPPSRRAEIEHPETKYNDAVVQLDAVRQAKTQQQAQPKPEPDVPPGEHQSPPKYGWGTKLTHTKKRSPGFRNACVALAEAPELRGRLSYDEFRNRVVITRPFPWHPDDLAGTPCVDNDVNQLDLWLQDHKIYASLSEVRRAIETDAKLRSFHAVRDYLNSLQWDGVVRLATAAATYFSAEDR